MKKYGKQLMNELPDETTRLLNSLCTDWIPEGSEPSENPGVLCVCVGGGGGGGGVGGVHVSCMSVYAHGHRDSTGLLDKASHLTSFHACDSSPHLPVTPTQLTRPGIG